MNILRANTEKNKIGHIGEAHAARFLKKNGYKILEKNFVQDGAEIDIICRNDDTLVFVEVKTRTGDGSPNEPRPASSVTPEKQRKIIKIAALYSSARGRGLKSRLDIIEVYLDRSNSKNAPRIKHLIGAFSRDTAFAVRQF